MPTDIHFVGAAEPIRVKEDYGPVTSLLHGSPAAVAQFHLVPDGLPVTVYRSGIAFVAQVLPELQQASGSLATTSKNLK